MISIIDYDIGNISAIVNMLQRLGLKCQITSKASDVESAKHLILPGNGSFDACMHNLRSSGLIPILEKQVLQKKIPILGICVGAQMLGNGSAEGIERGLGWIDMHSERFPTMEGLRIPHMGWNKVQILQSGNPLASEMTFESRFYFVHSYYMVPKNLSEVLFSSQYGINFAAGVAKNNIAGVQFHPEKSHRFGKQLLASFVLRQS